MDQTSEEKRKAALEFLRILKERCKGTKSCSGCALFKYCQIRTRPDELTDGQLAELVDTVIG
ncbi:MAG: hypothetical protein IK035_07725 [Firmicutes bacterium]|nr:hypothetical protein [Bacillota bacterium]